MYPQLLPKGTTIKIQISKNEENEYELYVR